MSKTFSTKGRFLWTKLCFFGLFSGDKGDYIDVWMIKIIIGQIKLIWIFVSFKSR